MTREEILAMEGRKLDWLVDKIVRGDKGYREDFWPCDEFSTDISAAWPLIDTMIERYNCHVQITMEPNFITCDLLVEDALGSYDIWVTLSGLEAAETICKAALLAALETK